MTDSCDNLVYYNEKSSSCGAVLDHDSIDPDPDINFENITLGNLADGNYQIWVNYFGCNIDPMPDPVPSETVTLTTYLNGTPIKPAETFTLTTPNEAANRPTTVAGPATQPSWFIQKRITIQNGVITDF